MRNAGSHLHAGPLAAEGQSGADGEHSTHEFHRDQDDRLRLLQARLQDGFHVGYAASRCKRREPPDQPRRTRSRRSTGSNDEQEAGKLPVVRPDNPGVAQCVRSSERKPKERSHETGAGTDEERQQREQNQITGVL